MTCGGPSCAAYIETVRAQATIVVQLAPPMANVGTENAAVTTLHQMVEQQLTLLSSAKGASPAGSSQR